MEDDSVSEKIDNKIDSELPALPFSSGGQPENSPDIGTNTSPSLDLSLSLPGTSQPGVVGQENALTQPVLNIDETITVEEPDSNTGSGGARARMPPMSSGSGSGIVLDASISTSAPGGSGGVTDKGKRKIDSVYPSPLARYCHPSGIPRPRPLGSSNSGAGSIRPRTGTSSTPFVRPAISRQQIPRPGPLASSSSWIVLPRPPIGTIYACSFLWSTISSPVTSLTTMSSRGRISWVLIQLPPGTTFVPILGMPPAPDIPPQNFWPMLRRGSAAVGRGPPPPSIDTSSNPPPPYLAIIPSPYLPSRMPMSTTTMPTPAASTSSAQNLNVNHEDPPPPARQDQVEDIDLNTTLPPETDREPSD